MTISSRFSVAAHILSLLDMFKDQRLTSDSIADSVNTNPVVIRRIMGMLNKAGLVHTSAGVAGARLAREMSEITLLDVYRAVQGEQEALFSMHENPNPACPVGRNIQGALETTFGRAQLAMENELAKVTMADISLDIAQRI
ncbi:MULTISPECIES: Rrf2 family transcriptional regulator [Cohnella]|uniref:Rrf2 family transcriptional regulator n=1 Tax=Cohnella TaxID=329857 RepID=UPI0009BC0608|nr:MULTISPECIES: Rrf2 family transcriptional regulator [Cohnella]MBN2980801.1 Rrf2 family transcriptional regulator [Cohnella algarum]